MGGVVFSVGNHDSSVGAFIFYPETSWWFCLWLPGHKAGLSSSFQSHLYGWLGITVTR